MTIVAYAQKPAQYFAGARLDLIEKLPDNPIARVLEIGCGAGETGGMALQRGKCAEYCGVELVPSAAMEAETRLTQVVCGDVETVPLPWEDASFDAIIMSEVLEHLVDPWTCLRRLAPLLRPGALAMASSPNVAHHAIIRMLLGGRWDLADKGPMDQTHLRWFTPATYREMFESAGFEVLSVGPLSPYGPRGRFVKLVLPPRRRYLLWQQISLIARRAP